MHHLRPARPGTHGQLRRQRRVQLSGCFRNGESADDDSYGVFTLDYARYSAWILRQRPTLSRDGAVILAHPLAAIIYGVRSSYLGSGSVHPAAAAGDDVRPPEGPLDSLGKGCPDARF